MKSWLSRTFWFASGQIHLLYQSRSISTLDQTWDAGRFIWVIILWVFIFFYLHLKIVFCFTQFRIHFPNQLCRPASIAHKKQSMTNSISFSHINDAANIDTDLLAGEFREHLFQCGQHYTADDIGDAAARSGIISFRINLGFRNTIQTCFKLAHFSRLSFSLHFSLFHVLFFRSFFVFLRIPLSCSHSLSLFLSLPA